MTDNKDLKYIQQFKKEPNLPKTYEQFVLEEKDLSQQDLYPELVEGGVGEQKGYGPCHSCGNKNLKFRLQITLKNINGAGITGTVCSTDEVERAAREIRNATGFWAGSLGTGFFITSNREALASKVLYYVDVHKNGESVDANPEVGG